MAQRWEPLSPVESTNISFGWLVRRARKITLQVGCLCPCVGLHKGVWRHRSAAACFPATSQQQQQQQQQQWQWQWQWQKQYSWHMSPTELATVAVVWAVIGRNDIVDRRIAFVWQQLQSPRPTTGRYVSSGTVQTRRRELPTQTHIRKPNWLFTPCWFMLYPKSKSRSIDNLNLTCAHLATL